jgi:hypothetical protein
MNMQERLVRISKIFGLYSLALVAAVACGESFQPANRVNMTRNGVAGVQNIGAISGIQGSLSGTVNMVLSLAFIEGANAVPNVSINLVGQAEGYTTASSGVNSYQVRAVCAYADSCSAVAVLINSSTAVLMGSQGTTQGPLSVLTSISNQNFASATDALPSLMAKYNGGGI